MKRSECSCSCHNGLNLITHFFPCCEPDPIEHDVLDGERGTVANQAPDVHAYRTAIADDCVCGVCSLNNCRFPDCSPSALKGMGRIIDDVLAVVPAHMYKP